MAARYWNILPWELDAMPPDRQAKLLSVYYIQKEIEGYYESESAKRAESSVREK